MRAATGGDANFARCCIAATMLLIGGIGHLVRFPGKRLDDAVAPVLA
jgi:hypothetical protein